jgi:hypothetical protein
VKVSPKRLDCSSYASVYNNSIHRVNSSELCLKKFKKCRHCKWLQHAVNRQKVTYYSTGACRTYKQFVHCQKIFWRFTTSCWFSVRLSVASILFPLHSTVCALFQLCGSFLVWYSGSYRDDGQQWPFEKCNNYKSFRSIECNAT